MSDYSYTTIKRYESLKRRHLNCESHPGFCLRRATIRQLVKIDGIEEPTIIKSCPKHYSPFFENAQVLDTWKIK